MMELSTVTRDDMLREVREMVPVLRTRSAAAEQRRMLPQENVDWVVSSGIIRMLQPAEFGGLGCAFEDLIEVGLEVGRGCGATAWMAVQWPVHNLQVAQFPRPVQELYWASSPDTLSSTCSAGPVSLDPAPGGRIANGRCKLSSGIDFAEWLLVQAPVGAFLLPRGEFEIIDDWYVAGLKGSGSKTVAFRDVFVPEERIIPHERVISGAVVAQPAVAAAVVGMARGALEEFDARAQTRTVRTGGLWSHQPGAQLRFAEATAEISAAELILYKVVGKARDLMQAGTPISWSQILGLGRDTCFAVRMALHAIGSLAEAGDSTAALYEDYAFGRFIRDARAAALHPALVWDNWAAQYSADHWGVGTNSDH